MIGNISVVGNMSELQALISIRGEYLKGWMSAYKSKGLDVHINKCKIVVINDMNSCGDDYIVGSILLPNSRAMFQLIEGNYNGFVQEYYAKLDSDVSVQEYITVLIAGLLERNFDYIFYFDNDDYNIWFPIYKALSDYLRIRYGIVCYDNSCNIPNQLLQPSILTEAVPTLQELIRKYQLSNRTGELFIQY